MAEPLVRMVNFSYAYPGAATPALHEIELELFEGEFAILAGRSGCGKSTLLRACCGLVPHYHGGEVAGTLEVCGLDVRDHGPAELGGLVGLVGQDPESQVVSATVRGELELPLELRGEPAAARARAIEEATLALAIDASRRPADRHPLGRRAAAGRARRGARATSSGGPARRADIAARPGRRRRADRAPAAPERGVGDGGPAGRAPARALPRSRRPGACARCRADVLRRVPARLLRVGASRRPRPRPAGRAAVLAGRDRSAAGVGEGGARRAGGAVADRTAARRGGGAAAQAEALAAGDWRRVGARGAGPVDRARSRDWAAGGAARARARRRPGRTGCADGPKRSRKERPSCGRPRGWSSPCAGRSALRRAARCCRRARRTCSSASGSPKSSPARRDCGHSTPSGSGGRSRATRATSPAASASASRWRW